MVSMFQMPIGVAIISVIKNTELNKTIASPNACTYNKPIPQKLKYKNMYI